ncbi:MAG TPA: carboxypeptidase regulatory-like domain-containing protein, partial [Candidatus Angelobacter sp.]
MFPKSFFPPLCALILVLSVVPVAAQQTLGAITGTVADSTGAVIPKSEVQLVNNDTGFKKTAISKDDGSFFFPDLPIGVYTLTFEQKGFKKEIHDKILVQANRTSTVNVKLQPGGSDSTVEVTATPLLNSVDTTNGYILGSDQIETLPLGTGSFTQLAILSPGANADFLGGTDTNAGLGNQSLWVNGQRDTSNSFTMNSVLATNLFSGKSSSQVGANRVVLNTGENFLAGGQIQTNTSVYDAIGQALPSPPQETIQELRVNTSMYDASQGANAGAHIEVQTRSGTNALHGQVYGYRQTDALNAAPYFFKQDPTIPPALIPPPLHRGIIGGAVGGPIVKDKLFFFGSYQWTSVHDQLLGLLGVSVPTALTSDRSLAGLNNLAASLNGGAPPAQPLDPVAIKLLQFKLPGGQLLIPPAGPINPNGSADQTLIGPVSTFMAHQVNGNIDYVFNSKDQLFTKYYFQNDPTSVPFTNGTNTLGFPQLLKAGSQVVSLQNVTSLGSNVSWDQKLGFMRQRVFSTTSQALAPSDAGINLFGSTRFPGIFINSIGDGSGVSANAFNIGRASNFSDTGSFQNQWEATSNVNWVLGRHTLAFGGNFDYSQLNIINKASEVASIGFNNFLNFMTGTLRTGLGNTQLFNGPTSRYYRAKQLGMYVQDKFRLTKNLNLSLGVRYDWDGPLTEVNGNLINFDPSTYKYDFATDTIVNDGLIVAGNNKRFGTPGASDSTLKGRQWGVAPRVGIAWSPSFVKNVVLRSGFGLYYDRGEFFSEFSPSAGFGFNGPFGVTLQPPFVQEVVGTPSDTFSNPFGTTPPAPPPNSPAAFAAQLPNIAALMNGSTPFLFGGYDPRNKLPYSENWNLDVQWQPANDMVINLAYLGNHGLHETLPIPFNLPQIATPQNPINGEIFSYGYNVTSTETVFTSTGGNTDIRVPFIGYAPNSVFYEAEGISWYHALQAQFTKRFSHGFQANVSYTFSHALDEGSGLGLFFNGNNPSNPRQSYGNSDFDRTHVLTVSYIYMLPKF